MAKALLGYLGPQPQDAVVAALRGRVAALEAQVARLQTDNAALAALVAFDEEMDLRLTGSTAVTSAEEPALA